MSGELYDRDLLGGRPPPDVDAIAYGEEGSVDRRAEERRHARAQLEEAVDRLGRLRALPDLYGPNAIAACEREVAGWRLLAGDLARNTPADLDDEPLF